MQTIAGFHTGEYDFPADDEFTCEIWNHRGSLVCIAHRTGTEYTFIDPFTGETEFLFAHTFKILASMLENEVR